MDLKRIRSFLAVAECGSFRSAADRLGLSQPALSAHVAELEAELQIPLLSRTTRRVRLTSAGERFQTRAQRACDELNNAVSELHDEAALQKGRLTVACTPTLAAHRIPPVVAAFRSAHPAITIEIVDDVSPVVEQLVADARADVGVAPFPERGLSIGCLMLAAERFVAVAPSRDPLSGKARVDLRDLAGCALIAAPAGTNMRRIVEQAFTASGFPYRPLFEVRSHHSALGLVQAGVGTAILPESALSPFGVPHVAVLDITPVIHRDLGVLHRRGEVLSPSASAFVDLLRHSQSSTHPSGRPVGHASRPTKIGPAARKG